MAGHESRGPNLILRHRLDEFIYTIFESDNPESRNDSQLHTNSETYNIASLQVIKESKMPRIQTVWQCYWNKVASQVVM